MRVLRKLWCLGTRSFWTSSRDSSGRAEETTSVFKGVRPSGSTRMESPVRDCRCRWPSGPTLNPLHRRVETDFWAVRLACSRPVRTSEHPCGASRHGGRAVERRQAIRPAAGRNPAVPHERAAKPERAWLVDRAAKKELVTTLNGVFKRRQCRGRSSLFGPHGRPDADPAQADEAGGRLREGREEPSRQDRSRRHRRGLHRAPDEGADPDRVLQRSGGRAEGRHRLRQGTREVRDPRRSDGQDRARPRTASRRSLSLPSLDELRAKIVGLIQAPATKIAQVVNAPAAKLARVVQAYASKRRSGVRPFAKSRLVRTNRT